MKKEKIKEITDHSTIDGEKISIPLYEKRKGKEYRASGQWQVSKKERFLIEGFGYVFFFGVFIGLFMLMFHAGKIAGFFLIAGIIGAIGMSISLFAVVFKKNKEEPMESHYYDVDRTYNAFKGETTDRTKEISKEEFHNKKGE